MATYPLNYASDQFFELIESTARALGAGFSAPVTRRVLSTFPDVVRSTIQLKATSSPGSALYWRCGGSFPKGGAFQRARSALFLVEDGSPAVALAREADLVFDHYGYDFDAETGLAKMWVLLSSKPTASVVLELKAMPESARAHADLFERHGLRELKFVGTDLQKQSMNLYFVWPLECRTPEWIQKFARDAGSPCPSDDTISDVLGSDAMIFLLATTFTWDSPGLSRWCLYAINLRQPRLSSFPPRLAKLLHEAPTCDAERFFNLGWSQGKGGSHMKIERTMHLKILA